MTTFALPRFLERHVEQRSHARALELQVTEQSVDVRERKHYHDPADSRSLRGIPAIGRGVSGAIAGSDPSRLT